MIQSDKRLIDLTVADLLQILDGRYYPAATPVQALPNNIAGTSEKMNVEECANLTGYVPDYIRQLVFKRLIPFYKTRRKLHFKRSEIIQWMYKKKITPVGDLADHHIENNPINHKIH